MGVYIKGMKMPKNCADCDLEQCDENYYGDQSNFQCPLGYKAYTKKTREIKRLENCPLIELSPHRRLIDADAFFKDVCNSIENMTKLGVGVDADFLWAKLNDVLDNAPTVIEASE